MDRPFEPDNLATKAAISVAGGQTSRSAFPATLEAPATMASNSAIEARKPFIFQLPAISGRMLELMSKRFLERTKGGPIATSGVDLTFAIHLAANS